MRRTREELDTRELEELFERFRQSPEGYVFVPLADACRKMGRIDEALEICDAGVKRHPAYPSGHVVRGKCLYDVGNRAGAREAFERVLLLDELNLVALKYLGMIEADDGNLPAAEKHLRRILSLDPDNKEIRTILHLVEEQAQMERPLDEPRSTMEAVDEILSGAATPDAEAEEHDEPAPALAMEADLGPDSGGTIRSEEVETSDELASVTLADIFAAQGYTAKAAKIYREVLRKQPANDAIRARLEELTGETFEISDPAKTPEVGGLAELPEMAEEAPAPDAAFGYEPDREAKPDVSPVSEPSPGGELERGADGEPAAPHEPTVSVPAAAPTGQRPEIAEKESLNHFRHWLGKLRG